MCVAIPGTVTEISTTDDTATVDFHGNRVNARSGLVDVKVGDKVLVHAGLIIQVMSESEACEMEELFDVIEGIDEA